MLLFPGGKDGWLWRTYHELLKPDRRYRMLDEDYRAFRREKLEKEWPMGEASGRKEANRRLRQELGDKAATAVSELQQATAQLLLSQRAVAKEQIAQVDRVDRLSVGRTEDLKRIRALEEQLEACRLRADAAHTLADAAGRSWDDVERGMPGTIGARLNQKLVDLDNRVYDGVERLVGASVYERLRFLLLGILPAPKPPRLHVLQVGGADDQAAARVVRRAQGGTLERVS